MPRTPYDYYCAGAVHRETQNGSNPSDVLVRGSRFVETFSGVSRRKPKGFIPPTPYSYLHKTVSHANGSSKILHANPAFGSIYTGKIGGGVGGRFDSEARFDSVHAENFSDSSLANRALIKARGKLKDTSVNLGVAFAERKATARLVGDTASRLGRSYRFLRRGQIRKAMDTLGITSARNEPRGNNAPQKWLELQYGWKPLLSDVYGSVAALNKRTGSDWLVTAKATAKSSGSRKVIFGDSEAGTVTARWEESVFVRIDALPQNEATISLVSLGITNPLLIGWELVPFSFVVDWFLPIGSYLDGLDALLGFRTYGYSSSHLSRKWWDEVGRTLNLGSGFTAVNVYEGNMRLVRLVRSTAANVPYAKFPGLKDPRSLEHMANGLSLLAAAFGRK